MTKDNTLVVKYGEDECEVDLQKEVEAKSYGLTGIFFEGLHAEEWEESIADPRFSHSLTHLQDSVTVEISITGIYNIGKLFAVYSREVCDSERD